MQVEDIGKIELDLLLEALFQRYGFDFRHYARSSLRRRMVRILARGKHARVSELIPLALYDVAVHGQYGWVVGNSGLLLHSRDGGTSWQLVDVPVQLRGSWFRGVSLLEGGRGFIVGSKGMVLTTDGDDRVSVRKSRNSSIVVVGNFIANPRGESFKASGVRRIEAVTGEGFADYIRRRVSYIGEMDEQIAKLLEEKDDLERQLGQYKQVETSARPSLGAVTLPSGAPSMRHLEEVEQSSRHRQEAIEAITRSAHDLRKELSRYRVKEASSSIEDIIATGVALNGFKVVSAKIQVGDAEELKSLGDTLRSKISSGVGVLGAVVDEKVALVCVVTDDLIAGKKLMAGKIVGEIAKRVGGGGGGRPHLATAGGKDVAKLDEALQQTASIVKSML